MKAAILVGGYGTRLRPLTIYVPKSIVDFVDRPILIHQLRALADVGVTEVVMCINYQPEKIQASLKAYEKEFNIKITCSQEEEPLMTGGPLKLAEKFLKEDNEDGLFFAFNSDVICDYPLKEMLEFHKKHGKEGTVVTTTVTDPSKFGVILSEEDGKVTKFVEKPQEFVGNDINAGLYLLSTKVLDRIELKPTFIERETFPQMAEEGELYTMPLEGFWKDIGQPPDYLKGSELYLKNLEEKKSDLLVTGDNIVEPVYIHPSAKVSKDAKIGPYVSIAEDCVVEAGVRIKNSCILPRTTVNSYSFISGSIIGWDSNIGKWARLEGLCVVSENVTVKDEIFMNGTLVLPHKSVGANQYEVGKILL